MVCACNKNPDIQLQDSVQVVSPLTSRAWSSFSNSEMKELDLRFSRWPWDAPDFLGGSKSFVFSLGAVASWPRAPWVQPSHPWCSFQPSTIQTSTSGLLNRYCVDEVLNVLTKSIIGASPFPLLFVWFRRVCIVQWSLACNNLAGSIYQHWHTPYKWEREREWAGRERRREIEK